MKSAYPLAFAFLLLMLVSCDPGLVYTESYPVPNQQWKRSEPFVFTTDSIADVQQGYNAFIDYRVNLDYKYRNIYFFVTIEMPDKQMIRDTVQDELMDAEGNWKDDVSGFGTIKEKEFMPQYRKNFRFPKPGVYKFKIEQGMTDETLGEMVDVGFKLRKAE
ncbi:MAG: gliding motility lipoprotein GldH [Bacteroidetes bacterium]|nr:gliding motility lipoprotein GldH [Bacteroidota bacterium]